MSEALTLNKITSQRGISIGEAMIAAHGKDFAMGALILSARFIAEGRPLTKRVESASDWMNAAT